MSEVSNPPPKDHRILLENDRVRVLEFRIAPRATSEMHSHPPNIVYSLGSARIIVKSRDQQSREVEMKQGDVIWSEGGLHEVINIGRTDNYGIVVEVKQRH